MRGIWDYSWILRDNWGCRGIRRGICGCGGACLLWLFCRYFVGTKIDVITQITLATRFLTVGVIVEQTLILAHLPSCAVSSDCHFTLSCIEGSIRNTAVEANFDRARADPSFRYRTLGILYTILIVGYTIITP